MAELQTHFEVVATDIAHSINMAKAMAAYLERKTEIPFEVREVAE